jgi:hypothetical protein
MMREFAKAGGRALAALLIGSVEQGLRRKLEERTDPYRGYRFEPRGV